jgi:hypothetical protein
MRYSNTLDDVNGDDAFHDTACTPGSTNVVATLATDTIDDALGHAAVDHDHHVTAPKLPAGSTARANSAKERPADSVPKFTRVLFVHVHRLSFTADNDTLDAFATVASWYANVTGSSSAASTNTALHDGDRSSEDVDCAGATQNDTLGATRSTRHTYVHGDTSDSSSDSRARACSAYTPSLSDENVSALAVELYGAL